MRKQNYFYSMREILPYCLFLSIDVYRYVCVYVCTLYIRTAYARKYACVYTVQELDSWEVLIQHIEERCKLVKNSSATPLPKGPPPHHTYNASIYVAELVVRLATVF